MPGNIALLQLVVCFEEVRIRSRGVENGNPVSCILSGPTEQSLMPSRRVAKLLIGRRRSLLSKLRGSPRRTLNMVLIVFLTSVVLTGGRKPVQDVSRATLDNGLRVVIIHSSLAPVVTTVVNYLVGSNESPPGFSGNLHAVEHMMFRGSPGLSADQLANIAAAMGGDFNAETQQSVTRFFFTVPKQDLDVALQIESIRMRNLLASDAIWDHERGAIEQEVAEDLSNPSTFATHVCWQGCSR